MLQDVELGQPPLETEALVGSILELAKVTDTPAPSIQAVYACVKLLNKVMLTEGGGAAPEQGGVNPPHRVPGFGSIHGAPGSLRTTP